LTMTDKTTDIDFLIGEAVTAEARADEIADTIVTLAERQNSAFALIQAYCQAVLDAERNWQEVEARPEYKFASRYDAQIDYARRHDDE